VGVSIGGLRPISLHECFLKHQKSVNGPHGDAPYHREVGISDSISKTLEDFVIVESKSILVVEDQSSLGVDLSAGAREAKLP